jgi:hypothetical protein
MSLIVCVPWISNAADYEVNTRPTLSARHLSRYTVLFVSLFVGIEEAVHMDLLDSLSKRNWDMVWHRCSRVGAYVDQS